MEFEIPGDDVDYEADLQPLVDKWTSLYSATEEKQDAEQHKALGDRLMSARGIEVGQIFYFGKKYSETMNVAVAGPNGEDVMIEMGSYGIGVSRLVGGIIEACHDEDGIIWAGAGGAVQRRADQSAHRRRCL